MNEIDLNDIPIEILFKYLLRDYRRVAKENARLKDLNACDNLYKTPSYKQLEGLYHNALCKINKKENIITNQCLRIEKMKRDIQNMRTEIETQKGLLIKKNGIISIYERFIDLQESVE